MEHTERFILEGEDRSLATTQDNAIARFRAMETAAFRFSDATSADLKKATTSVERFHQVLADALAADRKLASQGLSAGSQLGVNPAATRFTDPSNNNRFLSVEAAAQRVAAAEAQAQAAAAAPLVEKYHEISRIMDLRAGIERTLTGIESQQAAAIEGQHSQGLRLDLIQRQAAATAEAAAEAAQTAQFEKDLAQRTEAAAREAQQIVVLQQAIQSKMAAQLNALRAPPVVGGGGGGGSVSPLTAAAPAATTGAVTAMAGASTTASTATTRLLQALLRLDEELQKKPADVQTLIRALGSFSSAATTTTTAMQRMSAATQQAGEHHQSFWSRAASMATGQVIFAALNLIQEGLSAVTHELIEAPAKAEEWGLTMARIFHDAARGQAELQSLQQIAPQFPQTLEQIVDLDKNLLLILGRPEQIRSKFGESLTQVRKDLLDTGAAMKLDDEGMKMLVKDLTEIGTGSGAQGRALLSLMQRAGISKEDLAKMGAEFDSEGRLMVQSAEKNFSAVLRVMEQKFGGMGEIQSHTFSGLVSNIQDWIQVAAQHLGGPLMTNLESKLRGLLTALNTPEFLAQMDLWGSRLEKVFTVAWNLFSMMVTGAGAVLTALRPVTDLLFGWVDTFESGAQSQSDAMAQLEGAAKISSDGMIETADSTEVAASAVDALQARLQGLQDSAAGIRDKYDALLLPLKEQERTLDRIFQLQNAEDDIAKLKQEIARDKALSVDTYSSEGRSAALRLLNEEAQLKKALREQDHTAAKNALDDKQHNLELERDSTLRGMSQEERKVQAAIRSAQATEKANKAVKTSYDDVVKVYDSTGHRLDALAADTALRHREMENAAAQNGKAVVDMVDKQSNPALGRLGEAINNLIKTLTGGGGFTDAWTEVRYSVKEAVEMLQDSWPIWEAILEVGLTNAADTVTVAIDNIALAQARVGKAVAAVMGLLSGDHSADAQWAEMETTAQSAVTSAENRLSTPPSSDVGDLVAKQTKLMQMHTDLNRRDMEAEKARLRGDAVTPGYYDDRGQYRYGPDGQKIYTDPQGDSSDPTVTSGGSFGDVEPPAYLLPRRNQPSGGGSFGETGPVDFNVQPGTVGAPAPQNEFNPRAHAPLSTRLAQGTLPSSEINGTITLVGLDEMGNERFRQLVEVNRGFIAAQVTRDARGRR